MQGIHFGISSAAGAADKMSMVTPHMYNCIVINTGTHEYPCPLNRDRPNIGTRKYVMVTSPCAGCAHASGVFVLFFHSVIFNYYHDL